MNPATDLTEEDSDYDPFARWRPQGMIVDDNIDDELDGEHMNSETEEDNFAQFRPKQEEIEASKAQKQQKANPTLKESTKDYTKQFLKEGLIGLGGTWGDLAELAGLNKNLPGAEARYKTESEILDKMQQPGYKPSFSDIDQLSGDEEILPASLKLPTSQYLREANEFIGGPGEPETPAGRFGARQGKLYGSGVAFGQINPLPAFLAGAAGQTVEELGGGELAQTAAEILTFLVSPTGSAKTKLGEKASAQVKKKINDLRNLGYTDEQITLAINSASKGKKAGVKASKGTRTEKAFENFAERSDDLINDILTTEIKGYERGPKFIHEMASDAYGKVVEEAKKIDIKNLDPFFDSMHKTMDEIRKRVGHNPQAKDFITELTQHTLDIISNPTADNMIDFYQRLNGLGKWVSRNQKDRIISNVKESIKDTFKAEGPEGRKLAENFEKVNKGIKKAFDAEEVHNLIQKTSTQEGTDFKKLYKLFDNKDNVQLFETVLGPTQTNNLRQIAKTAKEVKEFDKAWKGANLITGTATSFATNAAYLIYSGNWPALLATKGLEAGARKLSEKALTDPKFQNLIIRGLHSIKNKSPNTLRSSIEAMQKYLDEEGININLLQTKR